ncbi:MAG: penicillin-binding transpeptidase domain-containing protein, partial [Aeromonas salmonicida]
WGHGWLDVYRAIEVSADTYFYDLAYRVGIDKIHSYMTKFGFGQYSGVDLYEETRGVMPSRDWKMARWRQPWYQGDTISIGIGQGYWSSTPIQLAKATSILTQNGHDVTPHLLKSTASQEGVVNAPVNPNIALQAKSDSYWQVARDGMWRVINGHEGTGRRAFANTPYKAAGKSGTAQVVGMKENQVYNASTMKVEHRDNALFVAFAPFDAPKAVVALVLENAGGGSSMAAPVARQMLDAYLVPPEPQLPPAPKPSSPPSEVVPNE